MSDATFERECAYCGAIEELVEDPNVEGLFVCRVCLARVAAQNERIRSGLEEEPDVEM